MNNKKGISGVAASFIALVVALLLQIGVNLTPLSKHISQHVPGTYEYDSAKQKELPEQHQLLSEEYARFNSTLELSRGPDTEWNSLSQSEAVSYLQKVPDYNKRGAQYIMAKRALPTIYNLPDLQLLPTSPSSIYTMAGGYQHKVLVQKNE